MRVLVIDDDRVFSEPLLWCLEQEGCGVTLLRSVDDVLDEEGRLKTGRPDCIILDVMMPYGMRYSRDETNDGKDTGLKLLEDIYKKEPNIPVIIVTVRGDLSMVELEKRFGKSIKVLLVKPVTPTNVLEKIEQIFSGRMKPR